MQTVGSRPGGTYPGDDETLVRRSILLDDPGIAVTPTVRTEASGRRRRRRPRRSRLATRILLVLVLALAGLAAWNAFGLWQTWNNVEREAFDLAAFEALPEVATTDPSAVGASSNPSTAANTGEVSAEQTAAAALPTTPVTGADGYQTFMIVGSDEDGIRADVIILALLPHDGAAPVMISLPRDLYVPNRCTQNFSRINANFNGCGELSGATTLAGAVQDFTGLRVDHFALFTFNGFAAVIDAIGGQEICLDHPVRDADRLALPAGCTVADGAQTLEWVRSRTTQEFVDGRWQRISNVSDLTRNERQQDLLISTFARAASFESPQQMLSIVESVGHAFTLDDQISLGQAVDLAWNNRTLNPATIIRLKLPVTDHVTSGGAQVLLPTRPFQEVLDEGIAAADRG